MRFVFLTLALAAGLAAQQPNTVTANVSLSQTISTGTAVFFVQFLDASSSSTVDSAVAALTSAGVTASDLVDVAVELNQGFVVTTYNFKLRVASGQLGATRDKFIAIQRTLANSQTQAIGWSSSVIPTDDEISTALQQALPNLLALAKTRAGALAAAMNASLGAVVTLTAPTIEPTGATVTVSLAATYAVTANQ
jgi:hypothetical protein